MVIYTSSTITKVNWGNTLCQLYKMNQICLTIKDFGSARVIGEDVDASVHFPLDSQDFDFEILIKTPKNFNLFLCWNLWKELQGT